VYYSYNYLAKSPPMISILLGVNVRILTKPLMAIQDLAKYYFSEIIFFLSPLFLLKYGISVFLNIPDTCCFRACALASDSS
jgi:hypothetical protein